MRKLTFRGGVYPPEGKELARNIPFRDCPPGAELIYPLSQHIGKPAKAIVGKGDRVLAGQKIAEADGFVSANIYSSVSGKVKNLENRPDVFGNNVPCIVIENDELYERAEGIEVKTDPASLTPEEILRKVREAGIIGAGGAGFPTHVKLAPKNPAAIEYLLANGAECEPYICCDDQLMRTKASEIVGGMELMLRLLPRAEGIIVIEENKPEAIAAVMRACEGNPKVRVQVVKTKYPQGGERSIISALTGRYMKPGMLPADVGCIVENVGTVRNIYRAVRYNEPVTERTFTVSGDGVKEPCNLIVKTGTPFFRALEAAGGFTEGEPPKKLLCGGPMMGIAMRNLEAGICKNNNALTVLREDGAEKALEQQTACIRCGRCSLACPLGLVPQMLADAATRHDYVRYEKKLYGLDCIACGSCTFVCPAKRPLMQTFKRTKSEILANKRKEAAK